MVEREVNDVDINRPFDYDQRYGDECSTETPLLFAINQAEYFQDNSSCEIVDLLLEAGANVDGQDNCNENKYIPLFVASMITNKNIRNRIIKSLLDNGANPNIVGRVPFTNGWMKETLIQSLVMKGLHEKRDYSETIKILLDNGVKRNVRVMGGRTVDILGPDFDVDRYKRRKLIQFRKKTRENDPERIKYKIRGHNQELNQVNDNIDKLKEEWLKTHGKEDVFKLAKATPALFKKRVELNGEISKLQKKLEALEETSSSKIGGKRHTTRKARKQRRVKKKHTLKRNVKKTTRRKKKQMKRKQSKKTRRRR